VSVMMMIMPVVPIVPVIVAVAMHRSAHNRAGPSADDRTDRATHSCSCRAADDSSANGAFALRCARCRGEGKGECGNDDGNAHGSPPINGCRSLWSSKNRRVPSVALGV